MSLHKRVAIIALAIFVVVLIAYFVLYTIASLTFY